MDSRTTDWKMTDWGTTKVGSAYLPEKQRGKSERVAVRHRKLQSGVADNDKTEPKLRPTDNYAPNSSWKRRALRTDNVETLQDCQNCQDCPEAIKLVRNSKDDWTEIGTLGYALALETLRTTLLILLVIVQLGAAWARHLETWLDAEGLRNKVRQRHKSRAGDSTTDLTVNSRTDSKDHIVDGTDSCRLGIDRTDRELSISDNILDDISDFTDPILDATGRTDCTKLTDVQKRYMSNCEGL
jgi:hypothetical protein